MRKIETVPAQDGKCGNAEWPTARCCDLLLLRVVIDVNDLCHVNESRSHADDRVSPCRANVPAWRPRVWLRDCHAGSYGGSGILLRPPSRFGATLRSAQATSGVLQSRTRSPPPDQMARPVVGTHKRTRARKNRQTPVRTNGCASRVPKRLALPSRRRGQRLLDSPYEPKWEGYSRRATSSAIPWWSSWRPDRAECIVDSAVRG